MESSRVIRTYLIIAGLYTLSASVIWGVNTLFLLDAGLDIFEVFIANAAFTAGMVIFEIPTGVVADTAGRRASFLLSIIVLLIGTLGYLGLASVGAGVVAFSAVSIVLGLGFTFYSGAVEAWLVDALHATGFTDPLDRVFARGGLVTGAAMLIGTVGGGLLGTIDLAIPFLVRSFLLAAVLIVAAAAMRDIGFEPRRVSLSDYPAEMRRVARAGLQYGWNRRSVRLIMIVSFIQVGVFTWAFYAWPPYFLELLESDAVWVAGVVAGAIALSMIAGNSLVAVLTRYCGKRTTLLLWAAGIQGVAAIGVGFAGSFWVAMPLLLVATGTMGVITPVKQAYLNEVIPSDERATMLSIDSMAGSLGGVGGQTGLGMVAQAGSIATGFVVGGLVSLLALVPLRSLRRLDDTADVIVGSAGSDRGACAAKGLPELAAVDSTPRRSS
jgi:MFS family permease